MVADSVFELKLELELERMLKLDDVRSVLDNAVVKGRAEIEDPSTYMMPLTNDMRGGDVEDISDTGEDDVDDILDTDEDDSVIDVAVPSFDPMENRLKALSPGQQLRLN